MKNRILRLLVALDILIFAIVTLGGARRNETISSACWSLERDGKLLGRIFRPLIDALLWFDPGHCATSWLNEQPKPADAGFFTSEGK